jgi:hypothetical protein
VLDSVNFNNF